MGNTNTKTIELNYPIEIKKKDDLLKRITCVHVRRFKVKDLKYFPKEILESTSPDALVKIDLKKIIPLIGSVCELTDEEIGEVDISDLMRIAGALDTSSMGESAPLA